MIKFKYEGKPYDNWTVADAKAAGIPAEVIGQAVKTGARRDHRGSSQLDGYGSHHLP